MNIRLMVKEDIASVCDLYHSAFWSKAKPLARLENQKAKQLIETIFFKINDNFRFYYVAEEDNQVLGVIKLMRSYDKEKHSLPSLKQFVSVGFFRLIKTGLILSLIDDEINMQDLYVEILVVSPHARGKGVGSKLLNFALEKACESDGVNFLTLGVLAENTGAVRLYQRFGFEIVGEYEHNLLEKHAGIKKMLSMSKDIRRNNDCTV